MKDLSQNIKAKVYSEFAESECHLVLEELKNLAEYFEKAETQEFLEDNEELERIFSGILKLAEGNISDFNELIIQAKKDWRNILLWNE